MAEKKKLVLGHMFLYAKVPTFTTSIVKRCTRLSKRANYPIKVENANSILQNALF